MGMMIIPNNNTLHPNTGEQPSFIHKGYFTNLNAASNLIHYITRTRAYECRYSDLKGWGAHGAPTYSGVEPVIQCFLSVQKCHRGDNVVRKMYHFVYQPDDMYERPAIGLNYDLLQIIACEQARYFYTLGHQVVYAVHDEPDPQKRLHIHFAVNSVNYITSMMLHFCKKDLESLNNIT